MSVRRWVAAATLAAVAATGCGSTKTDGSPAPLSVTAATKAANLRVALNTLQSEHAMLAAMATGAAIGARTAEFTAASNALDANSVDLGKAIGGAYGDAVEDAFLPLWRKHITLLVDYTNGLAQRNAGAQDRAVASLIQYTKDFGAFLSGVNDQLTSDAVAGLVKQHVLTLKHVIDAQAGRKPAVAATALREAYEHMEMIAGGLSGATVRKYADRYDGSTETPAADLRVSLDNLLREHVWLAASATGAALDGRTPEFTAAATALDANSDDIVTAFGGAYPEHKAAFGPLWKKHIGFVVAYTQGLAAGNAAQSGKAASDLLAYAEDFGAFLASVNPNLKKAPVAALVRDHILTLKAVIDAQAADDFGRAYAALRKAATHMNMIGDGLSEAILKHKPQNFQEV